MSGTVLLSVVIPTRDREGILSRTLDALSRVRGAAGRMEAVLVDDGSRDGTARLLAERLPSLPFPARDVAGEGRGPAAARNLGVREAHGTLVAFLGDDTLPVEGWLDGHLAAHARHPGHAVLGDIRWHPEAQGGAFLDFLSPRGPQFDFGDLADPLDLGPDRFFAANLSLDRRTALEDPFDERFAAAAGEDIEWGGRLHRRGVRLAFAAEAAVLHLHGHDLASFTRRMEAAGRAGRLLGEIRPEKRESVTPRRVAMQKAAAAILGSLPAWAVPPGLRRRRWRAVLGAAYCRGFEEGGARG